MTCCLATRIPSLIFKQELVNRGRAGNSAPESNHLDFSCRLKAYMLALETATALLPVMIAETSGGTRRRVSLSFFSPTVGIIISGGGIVAVYRAVDGDESTAVARQSGN